MMELSKLNLGEEFNSKARICSIGGVKKISIYDLITAVSGARNPYETLKRIYDVHEEFKEKYSEYTFPGKGQRTTPVANVETALELVLLLPGTRAQQYRQSAVKALLQVMNPSEEFVQQIQSRLEDLQVAQNQNFLINNEKQVTTCPLGRTMTHMFMFVFVTQINM